jgi:riboflavin kinase / FMN adenylyltransferase
MEVLRDINQLPLIEKPVITVGTFDGVHRAHRIIIDRVKDIAHETGGKSVLVTFHPHPRKVLYPGENDLRLLLTQDEKIKLLEKTGLDYLLILPFTISFSKISSENFIKNILVEKLRVKRLVAGFNHHFGFNRNGKYDDLNECCEQYGFNVDVVKGVEVEQMVVSSSKIRKAIITGDMETANLLLGYDYLYSGVVVEGHKIGRTIGFPTANIQCGEKEKLVPETGVYAVHTEVKNKWYKGMMNIGFRPTFDDNRFTTEVNIFDFDEDIYGEEITVFFRNKIRREVAFENLEMLRNRLEIDKQLCVEILNDK